MVGRRKGCYALLDAVGVPLSLLTQHVELDRGVSAVRIDRGLDDVGGPEAIRNRHIEDVGIEAG